MITVFYDADTLFSASFSLDNPTIRSRIFCNQSASPQPLLSFDNWSFCWQELYFTLKYNQKFTSFICNLLQILLRCDKICGEYSASTQYRMYKCVLVLIKGGRNKKL